MGMSATRTRVRTEPRASIPWVTTPAAVSPDSAGSTVAVSQIHQLETSRQIDLFDNKYIPKMLCEMRCNNHGYTTRRNRGV